MLAEWVAEDGTILPLDDTVGVKVLRGAAGLDGPPIANTIDQSLGDGAVRSNFRRPPRPFTLPLMIDLDLIASSEIVRLFQGPGHIRSSSGRTLYNIVYEGGLEGVYSADAGGVDGMSWRKFPVSLLALDPWWYDDEITASLSIAAANGWSDAISWDAALPWNGGSAQPMTVYGDTPASATFYATGPFTDLAVSVDGVGGWEIANPLSAGQVLVVAGPGARVQVGPAIQSGSLTGVVDWSLVTEGSRMIEIPTGGVSLISGASGTTVDSSLDLVYSQRRLTPW